MGSEMLPKTPFWATFSFMFLEAICMNKEADIGPHFWVKWVLKSEPKYLFG